MKQNFPAPSTADLMLQGIRRICTPQNGEAELIDVSIRVLLKHAGRLTDQQLYKLGDVFSGALRDENGDARRKYVADELETTLQEAREFDPEPSGPDYASIDAPYFTLP